MLYPEFQYRRPPPSYSASMQDYQNRVEAPPVAALPVAPAGDQSLPNSPPPSYRSRSSTAHSTIHSTFPSGADADQPSSRPPTYRSRAPSRRPSLPREDSPTPDFSPPAPADISFSGSSMAAFSSTGATSITISHDDSDTELQQSSPAPPSSNPPAATPAMTMQVYTVPLVTSPSLVQVNIGGQSASENQSARESSSVTANPGSIMVQVEPSSTQVQSQTLTSQHGTVPQHDNTIPVQDTTHTQGSPVTDPQRRDVQSQAVILHQRMESGDRVRLEEALQTLDHHLTEEGLTNRGASFDDCDYNTHL